MRIDQGNQSFNQYASIGSSAISTKSPLFKDFDRADKNEQETVSRQSNHATSHLLYRICNNQFRLGSKQTEEYEADIKTQVKSKVELSEPVDSVVSLEEDPSLSLEKLLSDIEKLNKRLHEFGIDGKVLETSRQTVPQNYTMYGVETSDGKKLVLLELENGEFLIRETSTNLRDFINAWAVFCEDKFPYGVKLSVDELKSFFEEFVDLDPKYFSELLRRFEA